MSVKIVQERLDSYHCQSLQEEDRAIREISQEIVLHALYGAGFFKQAAFHGGTCLRILYGLNRFSEDLDFALLNSDPKFTLEPYLNALNQELQAFGFDVAIDNRASTDRTVKSAFLKANSLGRQLRVRYPKTDQRAKAVKIKLEVDTNPPAGAQTDLKVHDYPIHFSVVTHDLPSLFAGKSHALLTREYVKGRDWFDFLWYVARRTSPNFAFLANALNQQGAWKGTNPAVDMKWYQTELALRIRSLDWQSAKADVHRFLRVSDARTLELWNADFFLECLRRLAGAYSI